nr:hypothetical protein [Tanacetum cinerariifolium]
MELYMMNRQHGRKILESIENGPLLWPSIEENRVTRPKKYSELSATEAIQADYEVKATNIILQGLSPEVYALVSTHKVAKELWKRIQLLMQGTSLTKQEREYPLALVATHQMTQSPYQTHQHSYLNTQFQPQVSSFQSLQYGSPYQSQQYSHTQSLTPLSITYPPNDFQSSVYHNVYTPSSSIPQVEYAPLVNQQPDFSQPDTDPEITEAQTTQTVITHNVAYQADDLDAYDFDYNEINTAKVSLMANLSHYGSDDLAESNIINQTETEITSDSNIIPYSQYKTNAIMICNSEETLMLAEESRSKMLLKQKDLMMSEKKVNTKPVDYAVLNQLSQDFATRFVPQTKLSTEQAFLSQNVILHNPLLLPDPPKLSLQEQVLVITTLKDNLRKLKGKAVLDKAIISHPIDPEMLKVDVAPLAPKLQNNKTAHSDYLKHTQEETAILREIVEHERSLNPLNTSLDYVCKYIKQIQELLIIIKQTCPCINNLGDKLMAVTLMHKIKRVRFTEPITSSGNTNIKTVSSLNIVSNKPILSSTGVNLSTSASGSQPLGNTKKFKIQQTPSNSKKNKIEAHPRNSTVNSDLQCVTCNGCLFFDNHYSCVLEFINNVNAHIKSKSVKKTVKRKIWKPTGKVFTNIGCIWRPTGRTFTIVRNACPLTRITTTTKVPLRKPISLESNPPKPMVTLVYSRKPKESRNNVPVSKSKINKSLSANKKEPNKSCGSTVSNVPSSSIDECMLAKLFSCIWTLAAPST